MFSETQCPKCLRFLNEQELAATPPTCAACGRVLGAEPVLRPDLDFYAQADDVQPAVPSHRGGVVLGGGIASLILVGAVLALTPLASSVGRPGEFIFVMIDIIGVVTGFTAVRMGAADVYRMKLGVMDPDGQGITRVGQILGALGAGFGTFFILGPLFVYLAFLLFQ
jgi:hypothetical protein